MTPLRHKAFKIMLGWMEKTITSFTLEVWERRDEDLVEEERAAVHLDRPREKAAKVIDIPRREGERERVRYPLRFK